MGCPRCDAKLMKAKKAILNHLFRNGPTRCFWLAEEIDHRDDLEKYNFYVAALLSLQNDGLVATIEIYDRLLGADKHFKLSEAKETQMLEDYILELAPHTMWNSYEHAKATSPFHLQDRFDKIVQDLILKGRIEIYDCTKRLRIPATPK